MSCRSLVICIHLFVQRLTYVFYSFIFVCACMCAHTYERTEVNLGYCSQVPSTLFFETQFLTGMTSLSHSLTPSRALVSRGMGSDHFLSLLTQALVKEPMDFRLLTAFIKTCLVPPS